MNCPKCGSKKLNVEVQFYDMMVSSLVDCYEYTCIKCNFKFEVKN